MTKKEVLKTVIFILCFLFILRSVTYIIRTNGNIKDIFTGFYAEKNDTLDALILGSSAVYTYYASPQLWGESGIAVYPLSSGVQRPKAAKYLVEEAYKTQKPELVIIELRMYLYDDSELAKNYGFVRGVTDNLKYSPLRIEAINALYPPQHEFEDTESKLSYYFDIMKYHSNWKTMVLPEQLKCVFYEKKHPLKGYEFNTGVVPNYSKQDPADVNTMKPIPEDTEKILLDLMDYFRENNQEALFIVSPFYDRAEDAECFNYMGKLIMENGFGFLDMNLHYEDIGLDFTTDFYDGDGHVNALGVEKVTHYLGEYIKDNYEIEDKRGDKRYTSWDESYSLWQQKQAEALDIINEKIETGNYDPKPEGADW